MNLHQLRFVCEVVDQGFNISRTAVAMRTSQPSVSRQILALEAELRIPIFQRSNNRIRGFTKPGAKIVRIARRVLNESDNFKKVCDDLAAQDIGKLIISTSHTQARYVLPRVIRKFRARYPKVGLCILQGNSTQIIKSLCSGEADLSISAKPTDGTDDLVMLPCYEQSKIVLVPAKHPLAKLRRRLSIEKLAGLPLITYESELSTRGQVIRAFESAGLTPNIILNATDIDVIKTYVKLGVGIAIVVKDAYDANVDRQLRAFNANHLFESDQTSVGILKNHFLPAYAFDFINLFSRKLTRARVERALRGGSRKLDRLISDRTAPQ